MEFQPPRKSSCLALAVAVHLLVDTPVLAAAGALAAQEPRTSAERSGFAEYTPFDSMWSYLGRVQSGSAEMRLGEYGTSVEGRALPYAVFSRPSVTRPAEALALGKPILVLAAGVHGDEPTLRESVLVLTRELATPGTAMNRALDRVTVLVVPQINPDGFSAEPRPVRGNARGIDLNRDYTKLEQPETRSYVQNILLEWAPHLFVDGHGGGAFPYNLQYQCPSHAASDPRITALCDDRLFPAIDAKLGAAGFRTWYYQGGNERRWDVGGSDARIGRNYGGFANMVGVLFESAGSQELVDGVRNGLLAYEAVVEWASDNPELLVSTVAAARLQAVALGAPSGEVPVTVEYAPEPGRVRYLIGAGTDGRQITEISSDSLMKRPVVTLGRPRPWAYVLPPGAREAVELLRAHRIQVETLREPVTRPVDAYRIIGMSYEAAYEHEEAVRLQVRDAGRREMLLPAGSYLIRTGQLQGRVAAHLLEPETQDGVVYWNRMDELLPTEEVAAFAAGVGEAPLLPIYKLMEPDPLPTLLLP